MEPLMPSEVARLVYGYLKKETNEDTAECFLKSSPHLTECYQMIKSKRNFNIKVNGFNLHDIFDVFGTMCSMIEERVPETCESKTVIEKLQYLLDSNHISTKEDKSIEKKCNMVDKCVGNESLKIPSITELLSNNVSKTKEIGSFSNNLTTTGEKKSVTFSSLDPSSMTQPEENKSQIENNESSIFQINKQMCSTPSEKNDGSKINIESTPQFSPKNIQNIMSVDQAEYQQIPEATSLNSMPGLSKDIIKDGSIIIDTGELVDTFLNDQSLLEKIANTINKCFDAQNETCNILEGKVLDPPTLEKALDSTQSDPQIKNILDEFLFFNVDNADVGKKPCTNDQVDSIKTRLRSAKKKDDVTAKLKKNNLNIPKQIVYGNEECMKVDNNIVLVHDGNIRTTFFDSYNLLSNQLVQSSDSYNFDSTKIEPEEDYVARANYVKIAPKITPMLSGMPYQALEKRIFPKRRKHPLEVHGIRSKFRRTNITFEQPPTQTLKSIIIEVPNQSSFETQEKKPIKINDIRLPEVSSKVNDAIVHDTPDDRLKPPKLKSLSTPRRSSTHIRCLDFNTPQPKNMTQNQARSKLFCDSPKRLEKCLEESLSSPLPKLQADWGLVNGFESIIKKETIKHWDTDIREMVGAGILTSDADGRKTRKKKTPRKKIKPVNDQNNPIDLLEKEKKSSSHSITTNELYTDVSNISESTYDDLNEEESNYPLPGGSKQLKTKFPVSLETSNNVTESNNKQPPIKSELLNTSNDLNLLEKHSDFPISSKTPDKITELYNEQAPTIISGTLKTINNTESPTRQSDFPTSLDTPNKTTELYTKQSTVISVSLKTNSNEELETPNKLTKFNTEKLPNKFDSSKSQFSTQINLEHDNINEQENNQNQLVNSSNLKTVPVIENQEKDSEYDANNSNDLNIPVKCIKIESFKPDLVKTPYKCDDAAVDVPETPITKISCEYDPSKLVTPLPSIADHYEDSLTKVFRETSYLNRPQISPFPPTPGNSRSVDTLIVPPEQDYVKTSNNTSCKLSSVKEFLTQPIQTSIINESSTKKNKIESTILKSKVKRSTTSKTKNLLKRNRIGAKKKQVYESVNMELFGSEISSSSSTHELLKTNEQLKNIAINKKPQKEKKISGFKPIPKKKSIESMSLLNINGVENNFQNERNMQPTNTTYIKPIIVKYEDNNDSNSEKIKKKIPKKTHKYMVHFDDPVEQFMSLSKNQSLGKFNNKNTCKIEKKISINDNSEQLIGLSRYLNKTSPIIYNCSPKRKKIKTIGPGVNTSNLKNNDSNTNYLEVYKANKSSEDKSTIDFSNKTETPDTNNQRIKLSENYLTDVNKVSDGIQNNTVHNKSTVPLPIDDDNISNQNCISENKIKICLDGSESPIINCNISVNTSCITVRHDDKLDVQIIKICDPINHMEYLKKPKLYEVVSEDGEHEVVYLNLSETFTFLDIPSELNHVHPSDPITSPLIKTKLTSNITPELESGELENDEEILMPMTSISKDNIEIKNEKDNRSRRSPSFWDDSVHSYPKKYRDDRHRELQSYWQNKIHDKYDKKHRVNHKRYHDDRFDSRNSQRSRHQYNMKREFREDSLKDKYKFKHKDEKRRNYCDYIKGRNWVEENERSSIAQRMSRNDLQKLHRSEDIVKKAIKRPADRELYNQTPVKVSKVEHQRLLKNVNVDDFLSVVHGQK